MIQNSVTKPTIQFSLWTATANLCFMENATTGASVIIHLKWTLWIMKCDAFKMNLRYSGIKHNCWLGQQLWLTRALPLSHLFITVHFVLVFYASDGLINPLTWLCIRMALWDWMQNTPGLMHPSLVTCGRWETYLLQQQKKMKSYLEL